MRKALAIAAVASLAIVPAAGAAGSKKGPTLRSLQAQITSLKKQVNTLKKRTTLAENIGQLSVAAFLGESHGWWPPSLMGYAAASGAAVRERRGVRARSRMTEPGSSSVTGRVVRRAGGAALAVSVGWTSKRRTISAMCSVVNR